MDFNKILKPLKNKRIIPFSAFDLWGRPKIKLPIFLTVAYFYVQSSQG